ncbi:MAG TPA: hypothetical protein VJ112_00920 [Rhabdochlamydiaceae bacterium]|nr:hypothetical protein [Rhabdochlamydiaceae bacterium]
MASFRTFKFLRQLFKLLAAALMALLLLFSIFFAGMQSKWAKEKVRLLLTNALSEQGWQVQIEELSGAPPFQWTAQKIHLQINKTDSLDLYDVKIRLAFFPMLRHHLAINYLNVKEIAVFYALDASEKMKGEVFQGQKVAFPFHFSIKAMKAPHVVLHNTTSGFSTAFSLEAKGRIQRDQKEFFLDLNMIPHDDRTSFAKIFIESNSLKEFSRAELDVRLGTLSYLKGFYQIPFDGCFHLQANAIGPWETWANFLSGYKKSVSPLEVNLSLETENFLYPDYPFFDRDWKLGARMSLNSDLGGRIHSLHVKGALLNMKAQADFTKFALQKGTFSLGIPDLALLSLSSPIPLNLKCAFLPAPTAVFRLNGAFFARGFYDGQQVKFGFFTKDLLIARQPFKNFGGALQARHIEDSWDGTFQMQAKEALIPFEWKSDFVIDNFILFNLRDFSLKTDELAISGKLSFDRLTNALDGALYANASSLDRLNLLFPKVELTGNGGINLLLSSRETEGKIDQDMQLFGLFKNLHYQNTLVDELLIQTKLKDLYGVVKGELLIDAEKLYTPKFYLNYCNLHTAYENDSWPFELQTFGTLQDPLEVAASGVWSKDESLRARKEITSQFETAPKPRGSTIARGDVLTNTPTPCDRSNRGSFRAVSNAEVISLRALRVFFRFKLRCVWV